MSSKSAPTVLVGVLLFGGTLPPSRRGQDPALRGWGQGRRGHDPALRGWGKGGGGVTSLCGFGEAGCCRKAVLVFWGGGLPLYIVGKEIIAKKPSPGDAK